MLLWCPIAIANSVISHQSSVTSDWELEESSINELPYLDSSPECIDRLVRSALDCSAKLQLLDDRIALIDR